MPLDPAANFVRGTTTASIDNTQTTVPVADASIFPAPSTEGEYNVVVWAADSFPRPDQDPSVEILRVTARDTANNELTVARGEEGTSDASHPGGSAIQLSPTAKMFSDIATKTQGLSDDGQSLTIEQVVVTNESLVSARMSSNQSISVDTNTTLQLDTVNEDRLSEYDTSTYTFTPEETGWYFVFASAAFQIAADGNNVIIAFRDATAGDDLLTNRSSPGSNKDEDAAVSGLVKLTGGNDYQVIVNNTDSSDTIEANDQTTYLMIQRSSAGGSGN